jgi:predicted esterase
MAAALHQEQPLLQEGTKLEDADRVVVLLHGRGATAESMLGLADNIKVEGTAFLIPQAAGNRWYPETAFGPLEPNEPDLSSALQVVADIVEELGREGISPSKILLGGFSQGACLAAEYLARNPHRFGGLFVLSGALIGPPEKERDLKGDLHQTPVLIAGGDVDHWVSVELFQQAADIFNRLNAEVDLRVYPGMGHTVNQEEIELVRGMITGVKKKLRIYRITDD